VFGEHVGEQPLGQTAAVELDAGRALHGALGEVHPYLSPASCERPRGRRARGRQLQRQRERQRMGEVVGIARRLDLIDQGRVHQAVGHRTGRHRRLCEASHQGAHRYPSARVAVQERELAVGAKARKARVPAEQLTADQRHRLAGRAPRARPGHEGRAARAEAIERIPGLGLAHQDWEVVTADAAAVGSPLFPLASLEDSPPLEVELVEGSPLLEAAVELVLLAATLLLAAAARAGSCPAASCTYTARKAALKMASAKPATDRRIRRARRLSAARRLPASALASSCSGESPAGMRA
jgi:hypothetical protein